MVKGIGTKTMWNTNIVSDADLLWVGWGSIIQNENKDGKRLLHKWKYIIKNFKGLFRLITLFSWLS